MALSPRVPSDRELQQEPVPETHGLRYGMQLFAAGALPAPPSQQASLTRNHDGVLTRLTR